MQGIISGSTGNYLMFREDTLQEIISGSTGNYLLFREDTLQGIISGSTSLETIYCLGRILCRGLYPDLLVCKLFIV